MKVEHRSRLVQWLSLDQQGEFEAALAARASGAHPSRYDIETFAAGDIIDAARCEVLAAHVEHCPECRKEHTSFRLFFLEAMSPCENTGSAVGIPFRNAKPRSIASLATVWEAAAAAGGSDLMRVAPEIAITLVPLGARDATLVVVKLGEAVRDAEILRLHPIEGSPLDQPLQQADPHGRIQFVKTRTQDDDRRFLDLILTARLQLLGASDSAGADG